SGDVEPSLARGTDGGTHGTPSVVRYYTCVYSCRRRSARSSDVDLYGPGRPTADRREPSRQYTTGSAHDSPQEQTNNHTEESLKVGGGRRKQQDGARAGACRGRREKASGHRGRSPAP